MIYIAGTDGPSFPHLFYSPLSSVLFYSIPYLDSIVCSLYLGSGHSGGYWNAALQWCCPLAAVRAQSTRLH
jgi:hypothetical protein